MGFGSPWHWIVIGVVALLLFGNRLPEVARSLGRALNEFKKGLKDVSDDFTSGSDEDDERPGGRLEPPEGSRSDRRVRQSDEADPYDQSPEKDTAEAEHDHSHDRR